MEFGNWGQVVLSVPYIRVRCMEDSTPSLGEGELSQGILLLNPL